MSEGGSNKESSKVNLKKNKKQAATRGRKNFNEFYDQRDTESQEAGAQNTSNMQIQKKQIATNGINGDIQVNVNGQPLNGKKEPSTYSVTTFGIQ